MDLPAALTPFAVSFVLLFLIATAQVVGLGDMFGDAEADGGVDVDGDLDGHAGAMDGLASIIGLGRLPFLMWFSLLLFLFTVTGFSGQMLIENATGAMLPAIIAAPLALLPALPLAGIGSRVIARVMPKDETSAVALSSLLGKRGHIDIGVARRGSPARAIIKDIYGQPHNVMVEPHEDGAQYAAGEEILLVRQQGDLFFAISDSDRRLGTVR